MQEPQEHRFNPWVGKIPWRKAWQPTPVLLHGESPWTEEPGGLQTMEWQRVKHDWVTEHSTATLWCKLISINIFALYNSIVIIKYQRTGPQRFSRNATIQQSASQSVPGLLGNQRTVALLFVICTVSLQCVCILSWRAVAVAFLLL